MPRARQGPGVVQLQFPAGGLNTAAGFSQQPPGTTPACQNVVAFDPALGRGRGGQRAGVSQVNAANVAGAGPVQLLMQVDLMQSLVPGLTGFQAAGPGLETSFIWPVAFGPNEGAAFNALEAGTPWSTWVSDVLLADAVFKDHTGTLEPTSSGTKIPSQVYNQLGDFTDAVFLACGSNGSNYGGRAVAMRRQGSAAPAGTWGPTYAVSATIDVTQGWNNGGTAIANSRAYLLTVSDGAGFGTLGNFAAGIAFRDNQYIEFVTITDNAAPTVHATIDLVAQFNALFPAAPGGPITGLTSAGVNFLQAQLCKQALAGGDTFMAQVTITVSGHVYTWVVGTPGSATTAQTMVTASQGGQQDSIVLALDCPGALMDGYFSVTAVQQAALTQQVNPGAGRDVQLVEVQAGNVYLGHPSQQGLCTNGTGLFNPYQLLSGCYGQYKAYLVDGVVTKQLDLKSSVVTDFAAAAGKGALPAGCRIAVMWRDRLILANQAGSEQNVYASRQGDYTDWNYGQPDAQSAWALNAAGAAGHIGQPITCFAPVSDDVALVGCTSSTFAMKGDPGAGGAVMQLSTEVGVFGQRAWCLDPKGILYFVGGGGLYRWHSALSGYYGEQALENLSERKVPQWFAALDRGRSQVTLVWDQDRHGCWVLVTNNDMTPAQCLFFDARTEGFFPQLFPAGVSPATSIEYSGDGPADRAIFLGGADGVLRKLDPAAFTDQGAAIASYVHVGPHGLAGDFDAAIITGMEFVLGAAPGGATVNLAWALQCASSPEAAFDAQTLQQSGTFTAGGRQPRQLSRVRGNAVDLYLSNAIAGKTWAFERCSLQVMPGGTNR